MGEGHDDPRGRDSVLCCHAVGGLSSTTSADHIEKLLARCPGISIKAPIDIRVKNEDSTSAAGLVLLLLLPALTRRHASVTPTRFAYVDVHVENNDALERCIKTYDGTRWGKSRMRCVAPWGVQALPCTDPLPRVQHATCTALVHGQAAQGKGCHQRADISQ